MRQSLKILNLIDVPLEGDGDSQRTARNIHAVLEQAGARIDTVCPTKRSTLSPQLLDELAGQIYRWRRSAALVRPRLGEADLLIAHNGAGWGVRNPPQLRIWHNGAGEDALRCWPRWHPNYYKLRLLDPGVEYSAGRGSANYAVSERLAKNLRQTSELDILGVIENAVDVGHFKPLRGEAGDQFRREHGLPPRPRKILLFIGQPRRQEGLPLLAKWARRFANRLDVALAGTTRIPKLLRACPNAHALGAINREDWPKVYAAADFFALPSMNEGCSHRIIEAMACGIPALLTDAGHARTIAERSAVLGRWICKTDEHERLTDHLECWLTQPEFPATLSEEGRRYAVEYHNMERFAANWVKAVEGVLEVKNPATEKQTV